ncbi:AAA family ATPase [Candidatus Woesearchaeota archaeon]|jgi:nucleoside-triphosphatase|nr:AAA family ATPase [Candidatus Woesearchaeota archaeon]MBT6519285.1 AAA family ATPase [Candidatus Woesearchaeota archaeon]MBT7367019.1 AAA family ATPase [Candidatus Woesearchaeota archaeon]
MRKNILITGMPRSGKSTLLKKLIANFDKKVGFVTNEVRKDGERIGFEIETNTGEKSILANINFKTNFKVSRYFVDIENLNLIIPKVEDFNSNDFLFLDEIGQMELFSEKFKVLVEKYLNSSNTCIATLSKIYSDNFMENIKKRKDIFLIEITEENRDEREKYLETLLRKISKAKRYISDPKRFSINQDKVSITTNHGIRNLTKQKEGWICNCEFFRGNKLCSHVIALEEYLKIHK